MKSKLVLLVVFVIVVFFVLFLKFKSYFLASTPISSGSLVVLATPSSTGRPSKEVPYKVEEFASGLKIPWRVVFTSSERVLVTERSGDIRVIVNGKVAPNSIFNLPETVSTGEDGLLGMTLDPDYATNRFVYIDVSYSKNGKPIEKIVRLLDKGDGLVTDKIIFDNIPAAQFHDGGEIKFGPDGKLYISTGDALDKNNAQDKASLSGKILRINSDGSIPSDNPFSGSPVWSFGHRNPEGFDWYPLGLVMYETEHGPSTFDGPPGGDEVNVIEPGENYGWPQAHHEIKKPGMVDPKIVFTPAFAPASGMFYRGKVFPQFYGNFFFGGLVGQGIMRVVVEPTSPSKVLSYGKLTGINVGRVRDVAQGPDGFIYFTTSNLDGRGTPREGDDKIYRLIPETKNNVSK